MDFLDILNQIKEKRYELKITQMQLANKANVSLATIQNIESGIAKPEISTLLKIMEPLGLILKIQNSSQDLKSWISFGLPLIEEGSNVQNKNDLIKNLKNLYPYLKILKKETRELKCFASFLSAIKDHFKIWDELPQNLKDLFYSKKIQSQISPKLRRIAIAHLSEYL